MMPDVSTLLRQSLLFAHIIVFALAVSAVLREDIRLLFAERLNIPALGRTAKAISWLLLGLWVTGVALVIVETGGDLQVILSKPKLVTKLIVVSALTANGVLLHTLAFPMLQSGRRVAVAAGLASILGAVSTSSWLYASFVGVARHIAPHFDLTTFLALYGVAVAGALAVAWVFVRSRVAALLLREQALPASEADGELTAAFQRVEAAIGMLHQAHATLKSAHHEPPARPEPSGQGSIRSVA